jgi:hypothetical protein
MRENNFYETCFGTRNLESYTLLEVGQVDSGFSRSRVLEYAQLAHFCGVFGTYGSTDIIP